jgi:uncharacterized iron-regulated membrane protein
MLAGCIGMLLLAGSAPAMWWKRRRNGRLTAPPAPEDKRRTRGLAVLMLALGAVFPLTGATMVAALVLEAIGRLTNQIGKIRLTASR